MCLKDKSRWVKTLHKSRWVKIDIKILNHQGESRLTRFYTIKVTRNVTQIKLSHHFTQNKVSRVWQDFTQFKVSQVWQDLTPIKASRNFTQIKLSHHLTQIRWCTTLHKSRQVATLHKSRWVATLHKSSELPLYTNQGVANLHKSRWVVTLHTIFIIKIVHFPCQNQANLTIYDHYHVFWLCEFGHTVNVNTFPVDFTPLLRAANVKAQANKRHNAIFHCISPIFSMPSDIFRTSCLWKKFQIVSVSHKAWFVITKIKLNSKVQLEDLIYSVTFLQGPPLHPFSNHND